MHCCYFLPADTKQQAALKPVLKCVVSSGFANMNLVGGMMRPGRRDGPMGNMADIAKRVQSQQAAQLAHAACDAIMKARGR